MSNETKTNNSDSGSVCANPGDFTNASVKTKYDFRKCMNTKGAAIVCLCIAALGFVVLR